MPKEQNGKRTNELPKKKNGRDEKRKEVPIYETSQMLAEIVKWENTTRWLVHYKNNGKLKTAEYVGSEEEPLYPSMDEGVNMGAIMLPSFPQEYGDVDSLISAIREHIHKYLDVGQEFEEIATYYVLLTWVYDKVNTLPYLRVMGDTGTGKSRFLDVIGRLCYRACMVSGAITPAPIYRMIRKWEGTLVLDEADFSNSDTKNEVIKILNCGFERSRPVLRCVQDNPDSLQFLPTFSPKVIATRFEFSDKALEARCITEIMRETGRNDIPEVLGKAFYGRESELRNMLLKFRLDVREKLDTEVSGVFNVANIEPRIRQILSPFAVFANVGNLKEKIELFAINKQRAIIESRSDTLEGEIVNALMELEGGEISSMHIADFINASRSEKDKLNVRRVGYILKSLGVKTKNKRIKIDDKSVVRKIVEWDIELMAKLKVRYVASVASVALLRGTPPTTLQTFSHPPDMYNNKKLIIKERSGTLQQQQENCSVIKAVPSSNATNATHATTDNLLTKVKRIPAGEHHPETLIKNIGFTTQQIQEAKDMGLLFESSPGMLRRVG